jgi:hypothetical protein
LSTQDPASAASQSVTESPNLSGQARAAIPARSRISASCAHFLQPGLECAAAGDRIRARREDLVGDDLCRVDRWEMQIINYRSEIKTNNINFSKYAM